MSKMKKIENEENDIVLKKANDLIKIPLVCEAFLMMMGTPVCAKNVFFEKKYTSNHLDNMVYELDKFADQKIQKLRYLLKNNEVVRKELVMQIAKKYHISAVSHSLMQLEENLGINQSENLIHLNMIKKSTASKRKICQSDVQVKS